MLTEIISRVETFSAQLAFECLEPRMNQPMLTKITMIGENMAAYVTRKNGLSCVRIFMYLQLAFVDKVLFAIKALIRAIFFRLMEGPFMMAQRLRIDQFLGGILALDFGMSLFVIF